MPSDAPKVPQTFWEENRERFSAQSDALDPAKITGCTHDIVRKNAVEIVCKKCGNGWFDQGKILPY